MRILIGIPCLLTGGTEIQTLSLVRALVSGGHEVAVACYFEYSPDMVKRYEEADAHVILLSQKGVRPVGFTDTIRFLWRGLKMAVKEVRPDVAHVQYMAPGALSVMILRCLGVKKIVATAHTSGDIYSTNGRKVVRFLTKYVLHSFQCISLKAEESFFGSSRMFEKGMKLKKRGNHFTIHNSLPN